jgi:hypothetical protein
MFCPRSLELAVISKKPVNFRPNQTHKLLIMTVGQQILIKVNHLSMHLLAQLEALLPVTFLERIWTPKQ